MQHQDDPASSRIADAVGRSKGVPAIDLPPLYETVDPDVFELLFRSNPRGTEGDGSTYIRFDYAGHEVTVRSNESIDVRRLPAGGDGADSA